MINLKTLTFIGAAILATSTASADVHYAVVPYTLSDGYAITGGTITTNDALDTIIGWDVEVTGPRGYVFSDTNPGATLLPDEFAISPTEITIADLFGNSTGFAALDNSDADCTDCRQSLSYIIGSPTTSYLILDFADNDPNISGQFTHNLSLGITVATVVPEPTSLALLMLGGLLVARRGSRCAQPTVQDSI